MIILNQKPEIIHRQMLKHMLSAFLLWLISKKPVHGYELIKKIEKDGGFHVITASKLYPILKVLTKQGLISQKKESQGQRVRKVYHITEKGSSVLKQIKKCLCVSALKRQFLREMTQ
ncbi:Transcriptional regulator PadR-like family protein [Candidatus Bilamarchaeum dharawalense]|uniref:Transcriptional regulator PadR-like family protein n=1 Tax=Candidatus Bilamarchaeum dharawalense TaxID=2885759 RepID=A0A5E4LNY4_9ARCH|nr:Transcriptional regulator PadR-like family protein [Candidatus Bilamarchaeum dharawalense]